MIWLVSGGSVAKRLVSFCLDCIRHGEIYGLFVFDDEDMAALLDKPYDFYEKLGKHSSIQGVFKEDDFCVKTEDLTFISLWEEIFPYGYGTSPYDGLER